MVKVGEESPFPEGKFRYNDGDALGGIAEGQHEG